MKTLLQNLVQGLLAVASRVSARIWLIVGSVIAVIVMVNILISQPQAPAETRPTATAAPSVAEIPETAAPGDSLLFEVPSIGLSIVTNSENDASSSETADTYFVEITGATAGRLSTAKLTAQRVIIYGGQQFRVVAAGAPASLQIAIVPPNGPKFQISAAVSGVLNELSLGAEPEYYRDKAMHPRASSAVEASAGKLVVDDIGLSLGLDDAAVRVDGAVLYIDDALPSNLAGAKGGVFLDGVAYRVLTADMRSAETLTNEPWTVVDARINADLILRSGLNDIGDQTSIWLAFDE